MATDVGIRVGVEGEKEFRKAISGINSQMQNLDSEMRNLVSGFDSLEDAEAATAQRMDILNRKAAVTEQKISTLSAQYDRAASRLEELGRAMDSAIESGDEAAITRTTNAYNAQASEVNRLSTRLNNARTDLNNLQREMRDVEDGTDRVTQSFRDAENEADSLGNSLRDAFAGGAISGAVQSLISGITGLIEETTEYRKIMASLEVSSEKAGYSAEQTAESYRQLYGVLGDDQTSATALSNLQALGLSQEELTQITDAAIGAWATYGDSIPIDGLAEAINETVKVGTVTGTFADVLNWAGTSEDEFNEKLEDCKTQTERVNLVMKELTRQGQGSRVDERSVCGYDGSLGRYEQEDRSDAGEDKKRNRSIDHRNGRFCRRTQRRSKSNRRNRVSAELVFCGAQGHICDQDFCVGAAGYCDRDAHGTGSGSRT